MDAARLDDGGCIQWTKGWSLVSRDVAPIGRLNYDPAQEKELRKCNSKCQCQYYNVNVIIVTFKSICL